MVGVANLTKAKGFDIWWAIMPTLHNKKTVENWRSLPDSIFGLNLKSVYLLSYLR